MPEKKVVEKTGRLQKSIAVALALLSLFSLTSATTARSFPGRLTFDDLKGLQVGVVSGYATEKYVHDQAAGNFEVTSVQNVVEGLRQVSFGQLDALVENLAVAAYYLTQQGIPNLRVAGKTDYVFAWSLGVSRKYPLLYSAVDKALGTISQSELAAVRKRWIALEADSGMDPETAHWLKLAALFAALLVLGMAFITFFLKRQLDQKVAGLRESERKYRELVEHANSIILRMDAGCRVLFFNEFAQRFFGFPEEDILGRHVVGTIVPLTDSSGRDLTAMVDEVARDPAAYANNENENMRRNGERVWISWTNKPIFDANGQLREILCIGNDITARRQAEEELRNRENVLQRIFEILPIGLWFADRHGTLLRGNPAGVKIWGAEPNVPISEYGVFKARRLPSGERVDPEDWALAHTIREGATIVDELLEIEAFDGQKKIILNYTAPVLDEQGALQAAIVVNQDITEREKLQAQLLQAQKMESVGRLAGGVAHDFNNMLGVILGHAELALEQLEPGQPLHADLEEIRTAAQRSANLTRQLLAFARRQTISPRVLDLNETVESMLKMLRRLIGEDIELVWRPGQPLWPVKLDPAQLDQVLANLCVNARDAIHGPGKLTIETANATIAPGHPDAAPGAYVRLAVADNGCGMDAEIQRHLFEPFFTTKAVGKGTGLGLATVYGIVRQNGGFIEVDSAVGKGTVFRIYLPRHTGEYRREGDARKAAPIPGGRETILLVEDEPTLLRLGRLMLEKLGYRVLAASNPEEALHLAKERHGEIDLLMTDVVMPRLNGRELAERLKAELPQLKALFMSGYTADVIADHGVLGKGVHFIQKPFALDKLAAKLRQVLEGK